MLALLSAAARGRAVGFMQHEPQTNEVNRCLGFLPCFLLLSQRFADLPIIAHEVGASAGLNTLWPHYHFALSPTTAPCSGATPAPAVRLFGQWRGEPVPASLAAAPLRVHAGDGVRPPPDRPLGEDAAALRLRSYVWSNQPERLQRLTAALACAQRCGVSVEAADGG